MRPNNELFQIGDRVRLNVHGASRVKQTPSNTGKVIGFGVAGTRIRVLFDGRSQPTTLHQSYLEKEFELEARQKDAQAEPRTKS
jgi:hypothetical protein